MRAIEFVQIQALARSACTSRVPPIRHNSLWLGPAGWDTYSVWPPPGALDLGLTSACGKRWLKFLLGTSTTRKGKRWFAKQNKQTYK